MMTFMLVRLKHALERQSPDLWGREGIQPLYTYCALRWGAASESIQEKKKLRTSDLRHFACMFLNSCSLFGVNHFNVYLFFSLYFFF